MTLLWLLFCVRFVSFLTMLTVYTGYYYVYVAYLPDDIWIWVFRQILTVLGVNFRIKTIYVHCRKIYNLYLFRNRTKSEACRAFLLFRSKYK